MPSTRLVSVAMAIEPDDLSICDIARSIKSKAKSPKSKVHGSAANEIGIWPAAI